MNPVRARHPKAGKRVLLLGGSHIGETFEVEDYGVNLFPMAGPISHEANPLVYGHINDFGYLFRESDLGPEVFA